MTTTVKLSKADRRWPHDGPEVDDYITVNKKSYFRFSGRGDEIHLSDDGLLCGKAGLSNNYAKYKPHGIICPKCKAIANGKAKRVKRF